MSPIGTTRQFNGVVSNDAFGATSDSPAAKAERRVSDRSADPRWSSSGDGLAPGAAIAAYLN